ncbi:hypothetical protein QBC41DRAFT_215440 [Cercophora samala]|uniref:Uncharacterized protein n=1 Tax=Cercophora samala TaxID=330535 RepID=A0AA40DFI6_9PEZI|nr:hypothetical protein QBC41DRAFT_215440 [Cercophora samala]
MMAAAGVRGVISIVRGILGVLHFGKGMFSQPDPVGSIIRITVGLEVPGGLTNSGGDLPDVRLFNEAGKFLGITVDPGFIDDGTTQEIKIAHNDESGQQATYTLFSANNNAICIATATITWPDGDGYGWTGDWGRKCGGMWYHSNVYIDGSYYSPDCMWIDGDGHVPQTGFHIHWTDFATTGDNATGVEDEADVIDYLCNSGSAFGLHEESDPHAFSPWRRSSEYKGVKNTDTDPSSSYAPKRNNATSMGPDFANEAEGLFCRMSDKTLWGFCDGVHITDNCFNPEMQEVVVGGKVTRDRKYGKVMSWGGAKDGGNGGRSGHS